MIKTYLTRFIMLLMILNGLMFISNIYILGDRAAAVAMHDDLIPTAGALMANAKVLTCFVTGILYIFCVSGIMMKKRWLVPAGIVGFILFDGLYMIQLVMWAGIHPRIWIDFSIFGGLSLFFGCFALYQFKTMRVKMMPEQLTLEPGLTG